MVGIIHHIPKDSRVLKNRLSALPTTAAVTTPGNDIEDHLACLLATILGTNNLNRLILGLVAGHLDLCAGLFTEIVDCGTAGPDNKPGTCQYHCSDAFIEWCSLPVASWVGQNEVASRGRLGCSLDSLLEPLAGLGKALSRSAQDPGDGGGEISTLLRSIVVDNLP